MYVQGLVCDAQRNNFVFVLHFRKLYVCVSMAVCLLFSCLLLFFLFPRSVTLTPVSVLSVMVYFSPDTVEMQVKVSNRWMCTSSCLYENLLFWESVMMCRQFSNQRYYITVFCPTKSKYHSYLFGQNWFKLKIWLLSI